VFPLLWCVVEKVAAVFRFLSNKIKLPPREKKEEKKHKKTKQKKKFSNHQIFGRLAVFHSLAQSNEILRD
jgi:hypothetical protein